MSQEYKDHDLEEIIEESTHVSGGWKRPDHEDELLKELNDIIMEDDEDDTYEEELRQRQFIAQEREKRFQRNKVGRTIGLFLSFLAVILLVLSGINVYRALAYQRQIQQLNQFKQDIGETRSEGESLNAESLQMLTSKYMITASVTDKTQKEAQKEAEKAKEIEAAKAKEVEEKARKAQEEANAKQKEIEARQNQQAVENNQNYVSENNQSEYGQYILPYVDSSYIPESTIAAMSPYQLYLARNEIYARRGRIFVNQDLRDYFGSQSWYQPIYDPATFDSWGLGVFNQYERANLDLIISYEQ